MIVYKPLLANLYRHSGEEDYGNEVARGFSAVAEKLSLEKPLHINDIFKTSGVSILRAIGGMSGTLFGALFLGGVKGMPIIEELDAKQLAIILENSLQFLKAQDEIKESRQAIIDAFEGAVIAYGHSSEAGDTLFQALHVAEFGAQDSMGNLMGYQAAGIDIMKAVHKKEFIFQDPGAMSVWLFFKSMREWVAWLENSTW